MKFQRFLMLAVFFTTTPFSVLGQIADPLPPTGGPYQDDVRAFSGGTLNLQLYQDFGRGARLNSITSQPRNTGNGNIFVTNQNGIVSEISDNGSGQGISTTFFNYDAAINARSESSNGFLLSGSSGQNGLQGVAFHPEFVTNGKFYTSALVTNDNESLGGRNYLGNSTGNNNANNGQDYEGVVAEWTFNSSTGQVDSNSYRELFRTRIPESDHPLKLPQFDPYATPGDENYGLLFIPHGDGDGQTNGSVQGRAQDLQNVLGKFLRINPLEDTVNGNPYSVPSTNPFVDTPGALDEIYTSGHRNPHTFSFGLDANGDSQIVSGEIGQERIEEINLLEAGGDFGWSVREGTFVANTEFSSNREVEPLPSNDASLNDFVYPAAQYDHLFEDDGSGDAVAGGFVIDIAATDPGDVASEGQYVFADFSTSNGYVYQASFTDILNANTSLDDNQTPDDLTQAEIFRLGVRLDVDGDGVFDIAGDSLQAILDYDGDLPGSNRTDVRFGEGPNGEVFITSKQTGEVYLVTNATNSFSFAVVAVPEPASGILLLFGITGITTMRRRNV